MLFELSKKEKLQRINRQSLKMFPTLLPQHVPKAAWTSILEKTQPRIQQLNYLRIATCIELNYYIQTVFEIIKRVNDGQQLSEQNQQQATNRKQQKLQNYAVKNRNLASEKFYQIAPQSVGQVKIGIIGGGVMGRLILNSLLVFTKDGLDPKNITLSTRQTEDLQSYHTNFGVKIVFDNQQTASQSDVLIICVPSTLDNWIINDLRQSLEQRIKQANRMSPMVFITTSNMSAHKLSKLFQLPILSPSIRGESKQLLKKLITSSTCEDIQKQLAAVVFSKERVSHIFDTLNFMFLQLCRPINYLKTQTLVSSSYQYQSSRTVSVAHNSIPVSKTSSDHPNKASKTISVRASEDNQNSNVDDEGAEALRQLIQQTMSLQGNKQQTFLVRAKKWRMAYHNYIS